MRLLILMGLVALIMGCEGEPKKESSQYPYTCSTYDHTVEDLSTQIDYPCNVTQHERVMEWKDSKISDEGGAGSIRWRKKKP